MRVFVLSVIPLLAANAAYASEGPRDVEARRALDVVLDHNCWACHAGPNAERMATLDAVLPPLLTGEAAVGARVDAAWMRRFLADPRGTRPHTSHPHELAGLPPDTRAAVAADLTAFLFAGAQPVTAPSTSTAAELERGRRLFHSVGCVACHVPVEPAEDLVWTLADWQRFEAEEAATTPDEAESADTGAEDTPEEPAFIPPGTLPPGDQPIPADLSAKYSRESLARFLADPLAVRPSGHMPDLALGSADANAVAAYLLRDVASGADGAFVEAPGLLLTAETHARGRNTASPEALPEAATKTVSVVRTIGVDARPADERFALRFEGILTAPTEGTYEFLLRSDDGSWLDLDGVRVIDNGGDHAPNTKAAQVTLSAGAHTFALVMYENSGGEELSLEWVPPGGERAPIPADAFTHWAVEYPGLAPHDGTGNAERGRAAFRAMGCASCHTDVDAGQGPPAALTRPSHCVTFAEFADVPAADATRFVLSPGEPARDGGEGALMRFLTNSGQTAPSERSMLLSSDREDDVLAALATSPAARVDHLLERRSCLVCHRRGDEGGVHPDRRAYFLGDERAELGDEGRFPPHLTGIGRKLDEKALQIALDASYRVRPYTTTRMPRFGYAVRTGLTQDLVAVDRPLAGGGLAEPEAPPVVPPNAIQLGRRLAGIQDGLGCVQCHDFLGTPSLGVRAVDLGQMYGRVRWPWFRDLLLDPTQVNMNSRMTAVFVEGKSPVHDVYGGDPEQQVAALWAFLQQGDSMAPPPGIRTGESAYEVEPLDRVRKVGVFMRDVSPKVLCVGTPEGVHFAWDMQNARLAKVWRGRFLNARGTWEGRAGALESPPSKDVLDAEPGPVVATFDSADAWLSAPWPTEPGRMVSRYFDDDDRRFSFTYRCGELTVQEVIAPLSVVDGSAHVSRVLSMVGDRQNAYVRLARGTRIVAGADDDGPYWQVEGPLPYRVRHSQHHPNGQVRVIDIAGAQELRATWAPASMIVWTVQW